MKYEPIKEKVGSIIGGSRTLRKIYYFLLDTILLRAWHVKREVRRIFKVNRFQSALDAGCGPGEYSYYLAKKFGARVTGVDVIESEVERCNIFAREENLKDLVFLIADLSSDSLTETLNKTFDLIISVDVMEHIKDDVAVFKNFAKVLEKNGRILISTPSAGNDDEEEHSFIDEHFRSGYSPEEISNKLQLAGLAVDKIIFIYGFGGNIYWKLTMKIPITLLNKSMAYFIILPIYYAISFPISLIFMAMDYFFPPKGGGGLLVVARKDGIQEGISEKLGELKKDR
jgi:2-polyprenyl-3-methyl-5-hydroxy-6-metoxy-1,4-benzoquinol methylase